MPLNPLDYSQGWKVIFSVKTNVYNNEEIFSCIHTEYGEILHISPYSVRTWENMDQNNSEYGHFLPSDS